MKQSPSRFLMNGAKRKILATISLICIFATYTLVGQDDLGAMLPSIEEENTNPEVNVPENTKGPSILNFDGPDQVPTEGTATSEVSSPSQILEPPVQSNEPIAADIPAPELEPLPSGPSPVLGDSMAPPTIIENKDTTPPQEMAPILVKDEEPIIVPESEIAPALVDELAPTITTPTTPSNTNPALAVPSIPNTPGRTEPPKIVGTPQPAPNPVIAPDLPPIVVPEDPEPPTAPTVVGPTSPRDPNGPKSDAPVVVPTSPTPLAQDKEPALEDLSQADMSFGEGVPNDAEIAALVQKLEQEGSKKEAARGVVIPNQRQDLMEYDNVSLRGIFRLLALQAGFNFIEPNIVDEETISFRFQNMTPLEAFMKIARARGFSVVTRDGYTTLMRPDLQGTAEFTIIRKYRLRHSQPKWVIQGVANLLGIEIQAPANTLSSYPEPDESATSFGGSNSGGGGGGGNTGGTTTGGTTGSTGGGGQNIGLPTAPRWTPSLPYDEPAFKGEATQEGGEASYVFVDRASNALIVKATETMHRAVSEYIKNVDKPEPQILIETKVVEVTVTDELIYGVDWKGLDEGITITAQAADIDLINFAGSLASGNTFSLILTTNEVSATLRAFQKYGNGSVVNMPKTMTRSNVPVAMSSTITDATPSYQLATGTGGSGAVSTPSGFNTFTTGLTIDLVPQLLDNGMIDINVNPNVANKIGEQKIAATETTPEQTVPIISSRSITASAVVPSGMTVMIGGLTEQAASDNENGIPVLQKIPILGKTLFGSSDKTTGRKTLLIFLTPKIIYPDQYEEVYTDREEWEAMVRGNQANIETETVPIPKLQTIRRAEPIVDYMDPTPGRLRSPDYKSDPNLTTYPTRGR